MSHINNDKNHNKPKYLPSHKAASPYDVDLEFELAFNSSSSDSNQSALTKAHSNLNLEKEAEDRNTSRDRHEHNLTLIRPSQQGQGPPHQQTTEAGYSYSLPLHLQPTRRSPAPILSATTQMSYRSNLSVPRHSSEGAPPSSLSPNLQQMTMRSASLSQGSFSTAEHTTSTAPTLDNTNLYNPSPYNLKTPSPTAPVRPPMSSMTGPYTTEKKTHLHTKAKVQFHPSLDDLDGYRLYGAINCESISYPQTPPILPILEGMIPPSIVLPNPTSTPPSTNTTASAFVGATHIPTSYHPSAPFVSQTEQAPSLFELRSSKPSGHVTLAHSPDSSYNGTNPSTCLSLSSSENEILCATGLKNSQLHVHSISYSKLLERCGDQDGAAPPLEMDNETYHYEVHHSSCTAVAWRNEYRHIAQGLGSSPLKSSSHNSHSDGMSGSMRGSMRNVGSGGGHLTKYTGILLWDIDRSSEGPMYKAGYKFATSCLTWLDADMLAVGTPNGFIQMCDVRMDGRRMAHEFKAHNEGSVLGIAVEPSGNFFASFHSSDFTPEGRVGEGESVVKLWDSRKQTSPVSEIEVGEPIVDIGFERSGVLGVASGSTVRFYHFDTTNNKPTTPTLMQMTNTREDMMAMSFRPPSSSQLNLGSESQPLKERRQRMLSRTTMLIVENTSRYPRSLCLPETSLLAISNRDGRIANSLGSIILMGGTVQGVYVSQYQMVKYKQHTCKPLF